MAPVGTNIAFGDNLRNDGILVGQNSGTVSVTQHHLERAETLPAPLSTVPFQRDPEFIHRGLLDELTVKLSVKGGRAALVGLGGVGKSQLAIEYAYRLRERSPETWVLWLHASNAERLDQDVANTLDELKVRGRKDPGVNKFGLLQNWLRDPKHGTWLLIFDNVDDVCVIQEPPGEAEETRLQKRRFDYVPSCDHGTVLVTSRYRDVATKMVRPRAMLQVGPMDEKDALALMTAKLELPSPRNETIDLVRALSFMPLALSQAAAYINRRAPRCSIPEYLDRLQDVIETPNEDFEAEDDTNRDASATNSILATWHISMTHIHQVKRSAADLLSLMSFFYRQTIPEDLLRSHFGHKKGRTTESPNPKSGPQNPANLAPIHNTRPPRSRSSSADARAFDADITLLIDYSFVSVTTDRNTFEMHRLVQQATQRWLRDHNLMARFQHDFIKIMFHAFPTCHNANTSSEKSRVCQRLLPHALLALSSPSISLPIPLLLLQHRLVFRVALHLFDRAAYAESERLTTQALKVFEKRLPSDHADIGRAIKLLASIKRKRRQYGEAEGLQLRLIDRYTRVLGGEHPETLMALVHLGWAYRKQDRLEEAKTVQERALKSMAMSLPLTDGRVSFAMDRLAATYTDLGLLDEAERLQASVVDADRSAYGDDHNYTLTAMSNLSLTCAKQERWEQAEKLQAEVLQGRESLLGEEHPSTLISIEVLARTRRKLGKKEMSLSLLQSCVDKSIEALRREHTDTTKRCELLEEWSKEDNGTGHEHEGNHASEAEKGGVRKDSVADAA